MKKLGIIVLALGLSVSLSGCLVKKKNPSEIKTISRSDDKLRIYQAGDWIEYTVSTIVTSDDPPAVTQGNMMVKWTTPEQPIIDPFNNTLPNTVLKETTTFTDENGDPIEPTIIRYISQDADGNMTLHALDDGTKTYYWFYEAGLDSDPLRSVVTPLILKSPMAMGDRAPQDLSIMQCDTGACNSVLYHFFDNIFEVVGDSREIVTNLGTFVDPFEITYNGGITPVGGQTVSFVGDVRDACGTSDENIIHGTGAGQGSLFVVPEIGIVRIENTCQVLTTQKTVNYTITIDNTSFPTP